MRQVVVTRFGGPERLAVREAADPEPGPGQVRVAVRFCGINFADILMRMGLYPGRPKPPFVPGLEVAGEIDRVGPGVTRQVGERVLAMMPSGGYAERAVAPEAQAVPIPAEMSFEDAAAFAVNYLTAYEMIVRFAHLEKGERILIHTAAGGVGVAAIQIARDLGAEIFGTASAAKHEFLRGLGVHHPIDYREQDFEAEVQRIIAQPEGQAGGPRGLDVVLDPLGGKATKKNYRLLRPGGRLIVFGFSRAVKGWRRSLAAIPERLAIPRFDPLKLMRDNVSVAGFHLGRLRDAPRLRRDFEALFRMYRAGTARPVVGRVFPLAEAAEAHRYIQRRENVGKVLLTCGNVRL